jgi:hypothetical protein
MQGIAFFKHPTRTLCIEISSIRTLGKHDDSKALEYAMLVYIMLNGDCFDHFPGIPIPEENLCLAMI